MTQEKILHICIITPGYASSLRPVYTFVEQLVTEFAFLGIKCSVIAPFSITKKFIRGIPFECKHEIRRTIYGNEIEIFRPRFISFSKFRLFGIRLSGYWHRYAINKTLLRFKTKPDVLYSHFWISGIECYQYAYENNIPLFVSTGESIIPNINYGREFHLSEFREYVSGVICVSEKNKTESIKKGFTNLEKCIVLPNGVDLLKFRKKDKRESRKALGFSDGDFIVAFIGHFSIRKGSSRVASAINSLNDKEIKSFFIGNGPLLPACEGILFRGQIKHDKIPDYLNCADVFVLPSLHEGCSNAIIEAMACGLPIIASDLPFNKDILNCENSILIEPNDIESIAKAIKILKDNSLQREILSRGALKTAEGLSIRRRAESIINFIRVRLDSKTDEVFS